MNRAAKIVVIVDDAAPGDEVLVIRENGATGAVVERAFVVRDEALAMVDRWLDRPRNDNAAPLDSLSVTLS